MNIISLSGISKSFEQKELFRDISFGMQEGERIGFIGRNGAGKSTLLRIIAGIETPDDGIVAINNTIRLEYLDQLPTFDKHATALEATLTGKQELYDQLLRHRFLCSKSELSSLEAEELHTLSYNIDQTYSWNIENQAEQFLGKMGMLESQKDVTTCSGGQKKRVALARLLMSAPDVMILDEPTNHLDATTVQWLQEYLQQLSRGVLFITHDRYFLDAVADRIIELDNNKLFSYPGSYEKYLERKEALVESENAAAEHTRNKIRSELAWLQKGAKARRTKQQSRINWIEKMTSTPEQKEQRNITIEVGNVFLGGRVIDAYNIQRTAGTNTLFTEFTYNAIPGDRIGIIGKNGSGKSTLLRVLSGELSTETGTVKIGETVRIGFFRQEIEHLAPTQTVIGAIRDVAEYIDAGIGKDKYISARELLERFLFPPSRHVSRIETLSGGELRRLELCRILMSNPNVLLLDEPTNDFDLATLSVLEEYLQRFLGVLIVVSHDRSFLDKTIDYIYAFEENGRIKQYPGNYTTYLQTIESNLERNKLQANETSPIKRTGDSKEQSQPQKKKKSGLSFKEQRELEQIEQELAVLEEEKTTLEHAISTGQTLSYQEITLVSNTLTSVLERIDSKSERWLELEELRTS